MGWNGTKETGRRAEVLCLCIMGYVVDGLIVRSRIVLAGHMKSWEVGRL